MQSWCDCEDLRDGDHESPPDMTADVHAENGFYPDPESPNDWG